MFSQIRFHGLAVVFFYLVFSLFLPVAARQSLALDSTAFNPLNVPMEAKSSGGGVPVGTIVAWPTATNPTDMENWLECNGQSITQTAYPELFALVGGNVPDYRGLFLRGLGGKSGPLQQKQEEGVYIAPGTATQTIHGVRNDRLMLGNAAGASYELFDSGSTALFTGTWDEWGNHPFPGNNSATFNTSITSSATETRPANMAVRYLIRALP